MLYPITKLVENYDADIIAEALLSPVWEAKLSNLELSNFYDDNLVGILVDIFQDKFGYERKKNPHNSPKEARDLILQDIAKINGLTREFNTIIYNVQQKDEDNLKALKMMTHLLHIATYILNKQFKPMAHAGRTSLKDLYGSSFGTHLSGAMKGLEIPSDIRSKVYNHFLKAKDSGNRPTLHIGKLNDIFFDASKEDNDEFYFDDIDKLPVDIQNLIKRENITVIEVGRPLFATKGFHSRFLVSGSIIWVHPYENTKTWWYGFFHEVSHVQHKHVERADMAPDTIIKQEIQARNGGLALAKKYGIAVDPKEADNAVLNHAKRLGVELTQAHLQELLKDPR